MIEMFQRKRKTAVHCDETYHCGSWRNTSLRIV